MFTVAEIVTWLMAQVIGFAGAILMSGRFKSAVTVVEAVAVQPFVPLVTRSWYTPSEVTAGVSEVGPAEITPFTVVHW